jgi:hypothetical protein
MWVKVAMLADDVDTAVVELNDSEYAIVKKFLEQVREQQSVYGWVGGHWSISQPYKTKEEAEAIEYFEICKED